MENSGAPARAFLRHGNGGEMNVIAYPIRYWASGREEQYKVTCIVTTGDSGSFWDPPEPTEVEIVKVVRLSDNKDVTNHREGYYFYDGLPYEKLCEDVINGNDSNSRSSSY